MTEHRPTKPRCQFVERGQQCTKEALSRGGKNLQGEPVLGAILTCEEHELRWHPPLPGQLLRTLEEIGDRVVKP